MKRFAVLGTTAPTQEQAALAAKLGIELVPVGTDDPFRPVADDDGVDDSMVIKGNLALKIPGYDGVIVDHPAQALNHILRRPVGVFGPNILRIWWLQEGCTGVKNYWYIEEVRG